MQNIYVPVYFFICTIVAAAFAAPLLSGPLFGSGDVAVWEFLGSYFSSHLSFTPFPSVSFVTDSVFYPYGINAVFQAWSVERELFYTVVKSGLGIESAFTLYYILSLLITCCGVYALFRKTFGDSQAACAGIVIAFFNFYAMAKFPGHLNMAVVHWMSLSVCLDYLLVYRLSDGQAMSLRLVLLRVLLLVLSVGHSLGYVAGFALLSFVVMLLSASVISLTRMVRKQPRLARCSDALASFVAEAKEHSWQCLGLLVAIICVSFFYIPLDWSIYSAVKAVPHAGQGAVMWSSPWRLLIPWCPWLNPVSLPAEWQQLLGVEWSEGLGANSPGYFLLVTALIGAWFCVRKTALIFPLLLFGLAVANHPYQAFSITHLPWLEFARVGSRSSVLLAPVLALPLLSIPLQRGTDSRWGRVGMLGLVCVAVCELWTFHSVVNYVPPKIDDSFYAYMDTVRKADGEAVLDWPFCVAGGNTVGTSQLGVFYGRNSYVSFLNVYHGKKVLGLYAGRMTHEQIRPYLAAGFDKLMVPDSSDYMRAKRQRRPMRPDEWAFLDAFYTLNDFAGMNLYTDLIHPDDIAVFFQRFGQPAARTILPGVDEVVFIPKDDARKQQENAEKGKQLVFLPLLDDAASNVASHIGSLARRDRILTALGFVPARSERGAVMVASSGAVLMFRMAADRPVTVSIAGGTLNGAKVAIRADGGTLQLQKSFHGSVVIPGHAGINRLEIVSESAGHVVAFQDIQIAVK